MSSGRRGRADKEPLGQRQTGAAERTRVNADRAFLHRRDAQTLDVDCRYRIARRGDQLWRAAGGIHPSITAASKSMTEEAATMA